MKLQLYNLITKVLKGSQFLICFNLLSLTYLSAQSIKESAVSDNQDETEIEIRLKFELFKINDKVSLKAQVRKNDGEKFQPLFGSVINFYKGEVLEDNIVGRDTTNSNGIAMLLLNIESNQVENISYTAVVENNDDISESLDLPSSYMMLELTEDDSIKTASIILGKPGGDGKILPLADKECKLLVKRLFGYLPLTDESLTTDEEGRVSFEIPNEIKGDRDGNITIVARLIDDEDLGNVEVSKTVDWGLPLDVNNFYSKRELWSARSNAPIPLIIIVNIMLALIWGTMIYVVFRIFKINKLGKVV